MGSSSGGATYPHHHPGQQSQGLTALLVMIAVLCILLAYCLWGAPWCRAFCRRRICCACPMDEPNQGSRADLNQQETNRAATPTIILLPHGRMLLVDGSVIAQLQADSRGGLDLMELGENIIRNQQYQTGSTPSILQIDSETTSKGLPSPLFDFPPPPTYNSIFGSRFYFNDMPPSYSDVDLQLRNLANRQAISTMSLQQQTVVEDEEETCNSEPEDVNESTL